MTPQRPALSTAQLADFSRFFADEVRSGAYNWAFDAENRWHRRIYRDDRVDIWLISWLPTQGTQLHDHGGSSGAFTVLSGTLNEVQAAGPAHAPRLGERERSADETVTFGPRYIHDVRNTSDAPAVSVHAYSPPLTLMRYYDLAFDGSLEQIAALATDDPEQPLDAAQDGERAAASSTGSAASSPNRTGAAPAAEFESVEDLLRDARSRLDRLSPMQAALRALEHGDRLVDIRPAWQREREGEIPGALIVERNHLEWRLHPSSPDRVAGAAAGTRWIVLCSEGYTSSLAADALNSLGVPATDIEGGFNAWIAAGLPYTATVTPVEQRVGAHSTAHQAGQSARKVHA
jgi:rhodanese-related sulfurtransferase